MSETEWTKETWVYQGRCYNREEKVCHAWYPVTMKEGLAEYDRLTPGEEVYIFKGNGGKLVKKVFVGGIYEVQVRREGERLFVSGSHDLVYTRHWLGDETLLRKWQLEDSSFELLRKRQALEKKDESEISLRTMLEPLRHRYQRAPANQRAAILARIIYEVTR